MLKPFEKLQFGTTDTIDRRADLLNKLSGGLASMFQNILRVIGEATAVPLAFSANVDFGTADPTPDAVTATITDVGVTAGSKIVASVAPAVGRDHDEMEFGPVVVAPGNIIAGRSFDVMVVAVDGTAHGQYTVSCTRT